MSNRITLHVEFYFKGEAISPKVTLDLDSVMSTYGQLPNLHDMLAKSSDIDSYSYEYEMLIAEPVIFSDPSGSAINYFNEGQFDVSQFEQDWKQNQRLKQLAPLLKECLNIEDIEQHPSLKKVLIAACELGQSNQLNHEWNVER
jgi:hypothetical protein